MNSKLILTGLLGLSALVPQAFADDASSAPAEAPAPAAQPAQGAVAQALAGIPVLNGKTPNTHARYYIYLCSASWCGPCNKGMPKMVETYKEMAAAGLVELILVSFDRSEDDARWFVEHYGATFPCIARASGDKLPGYTSPRGIPHAIFVDAEGKLINEGHGYMAGEYKKVIDAYEREHGLPQTFPEAHAPQP